MPPAPLLFDLDGTLVDSLADICATANWLRRSYGLSEVPPDVGRTYVGDGASRLIERALGELSLPAETLAGEALARYREHHREQCTRLVAPYPGVRQSLARWAEAGHPMAVVTNKPAEFADRILAHVGLAELLPVVIAGDTLAARKPDPAPVLEALRRLGASESRGSDGRSSGAGAALMVGDGVQDLRAGKAAGVRTAACLFGFSDAAVLRAEGADEYWVAFGRAER